MAHFTVGQLSCIVICIALYFFSCACAYVCLSALTHTCFFFLRVTQSKIYASIARTVCRELNCMS